MSDPKISVIMPVFNAEDFLAPAVESVLAQTVSSVELIAVDDGSTDGSAEVLEDYARRDERVIVLRQENRGCSDGRNRAMEVARGRWLAFLDADDVLLPESLETWLRLAEAEDLELVIGNGFVWSGKSPQAPAPISSKVLLHAQPWEQVLTGREWIRHCVDVREWPHYVWLQLVRGDLVERLGLQFRSGIGHQDILWTTHLALGVERMACARAPLCAYRKNPVSVSRKPTEKAAVKRARSYLVVFEELRDLAQTVEEPALRRAIFRQINREAGHFLGLIRKRITTPHLRSELAGQFLERGLIRAMFKGVETGNDFWRTIRCRLLFAMLARRRDGSAAPASTGVTTPGEGSHRNAG